MFSRNYKLKSNNTLKNSEKKHLAQRITEEFSIATEENVKELVPVKSNTSCMKLVLHSGTIVNVYVVDGIPMIIEDENGLMPTVCALWKVSNIIPTLIIHTPVLSKVAGGAPLYLPGVVKGGSLSGAGWQRGAVIAACTQDNRAAAIVGRALLDHKETMLLAAGVCLDTVHVYGDQLCKDIKFNKIERPKLGPASYPGEDVSQLAANLNELSVRPVVEEWPSLGPRSAPTTVSAATPAPHQPRLITEELPQEANADDSGITNEDNSTMAEEEECDPETEDAFQIPTDMDGLLRWCLLTFLKQSGKRTELPLKTNLLYKNHLMPLCPPERALDVKKSSYKKMGKFLEAMQQEGLVEVREIEKGVSALVALHLSHPLVRAHIAPAAAPAPAPAAACDDTRYKPPRITEVFCLTAAVMDLFPGLKKGTVLTAADIRAGVEQHVRNNRLHCDRALKLDPLLAKITRKNEGEVVDWEEVMCGVRDSLTAATLVEDGDGEEGKGSRLIKSRLPPITMQVATRAGNKKVTLVSNLEAFGFNLQSLCHACQHAAATACSLTRSPGSKHDQLLLQGDQTHFIAKLLIEKYGLPKKYVDGADKALKKKK